MRFLKRYRWWALIAAALLLVSAGMWLRQDKTELQKTYDAIYIGEPFEKVADSFPDLELDVWTHSGDDYVSSEGDEVLWLKFSGNFPNRRLAEKQIYSHRWMSVKNWLRRHLSG